MHETFNQFTRSRLVRFGEGRGRGPFRMKRNTHIYIYIYASRSRWSANRARQAHFRKSIDRETPPFRQSQYAHKSPLYNSGSRRRRRRVELTLCGKFFSNRSFKKKIPAWPFSILLFTRVVDFPPVFIHLESNSIEFFFSRITILPPSRKKKKKNPKGIDFLGFFGRFLRFLYLSRWLTGVCLSWDKKWRAWPPCCSPVEV